MFRKLSRHLKAQDTTCLAQPAEYVKTLEYRNDVPQMHKGHLFAHYKTYMLNL